MYYHSNPNQGPLPRGIVHVPAYNPCVFVTMGVFQIILGLSAMSCGMVQILYNFGWRPTWYFLGYAIWSGFMMLVVGCVALGAGGKRTRGCASCTIVFAWLSFLCCGCHLTFSILDYHQFIDWGHKWTNYEVFYHSIFISLVGSGLFGVIFNIVLIVKGFMGCCGRPLTVEPRLIVALPMHAASYNNYGHVMMNSPEMQQGPPIQQNYPDYPYSVK